MKDQFPAAGYGINVLRIEPERLLPLLKQYPDTEMEAYFQFLMPWVFLNNE
jgi:hypothetical protein